MTPTTIFIIEKNYCLRV